MNPLVGYDATNDKNIGLEVNNRTVAQAGLGFDPKKYVNKGHLERMSRLNNDINSLEFYLKKMYKADKISNSQACVYKGVSADKKTLTFTGIANIPLAFISDFFAKIGTVYQVNFELKLHTNIGQNNSWTYNFSVHDTTYPTTLAAIPSMINQSVSAVQSIGNVCPFIVSPASHKSDTGLSIFPDATKLNCAVTITSRIGYDMDPARPNDRSGLPCQIIIPQHRMNPQLSSKILSLNEPQRILYNDIAFIEWEFGKDGLGPVRKGFNNEVIRPRKLLIFPFLSKDLGCGVPTFQQCTSSCPNTISPVRLRNFKLKKGGTPMFIEPLQYNYQYYNNHYLPLECANGASLKSEYHTGQITRTMWEKCYGVYEFDLQATLDEVQDTNPQTFAVEFDIDTIGANSGVGLEPLKYDFLFMFVNQHEYKVSRSTGLIISTQ
jgi:hypothetical protein